MAKHLTGAAAAAIILAAALLSCGETSKDAGPAGPKVMPGSENDGYWVQGWMNDTASGEVIVGAKVDLWDGMVFLGTTYTNQNGWFCFDLGPEFELHDLTAVATKEGYSDDVTTFRYYVDPTGARWHNKDMFPGAGTGENEPPPNGPKTPDEHYDVYGYVNDRETGKAIGSATLSFYDTFYNPPEYIATTTTDSSGWYIQAIGPRHMHRIRVIIRKTGYEEAVHEFRYYYNPAPSRSEEFDMVPLGGK